MGRDHSEGERDIGLTGKARRCLQKSGAPLEKSLPKRILVRGPSTAHVSSEHDMRPLPSASHFVVEGCFVQLIKPE
jgi:hypothetical protein